MNIRQESLGLGLAALALLGTVAFAQGNSARGAENAPGVGAESRGRHAATGERRGEHGGEQVGEQAGEQGGRRGAREHGRAAFGKKGWRFRARARDARAFVRGLELTDAQRALAQQEAEALRPTARALRDEARGILAAARERARSGDREGARADARTALRELRERARAEFTPHGRALVASLTPEQRARIEARLAERGRTFDPERASLRAGRWLARGRTGGSSTTPR